MLSAYNTLGNEGTNIAPEATPAVRRKLTPSAAEILADRTGHLPVWVRAPKAGGHEHFSGQTRATLYAWATEGLIRTASIRQPGKVRGVRLFHLGSILAFIEASEGATGTREGCAR